MAPQVSRWVQRYHEDIFSYGPLPMGWSVYGLVNMHKYRSPAPENVTFDHHPLSPEGRAGNPKFLPNNDNRSQFRGIAQPPIGNDTSRLQWVPYANPLAALTHALDAQLNEITEAGIQKDVEKVKTAGLINTTLYHPADRDLLITDAEPYLSAVARENKRNLIVLSPRVEDSSQWDLIWGTTSKIPVLMRWSTGEQDDLKPIILGCIPKFGQAPAKMGLWYVIVPTDQSKAGWSWFWSRPKWSDWYKGCGWPTRLSFEDFAWVMVAAQRSITLGMKIPDEQLGEWVIQFGQQFLVTFSGKGAKAARANRKAVKFVFDPKKRKQYNGPVLTYQKLSADIMMSKPGETVRTFASQWDAAIRAMWKYKAARNTYGGEKEWRELLPFLQIASAISTE